MLFKHIIAGCKSEQIFNKNGTIYNLQLKEKNIYLKYPMHLKNLHNNVAIFLHEMHLT